MARIYHNAEKVAVYLGEKTPDSDKVMAWFCELDNPFDFGSVNGSDSSFNKGARRAGKFGNRSTRNQPVQPGQTGKSKIKAFFRRLWFHRV